MFTFSQLVDEMVAETRRPDLVSEIARYVNQTIREVHFDPERNAALFYSENFREEQVITTSESGQTWELRNPQTFQLMAAVSYPNRYNSNGHAVWARETTPGRHLNDLDFFYYRTGGTFVFAGYGGIGSVIHLAYYEFPSSLKYHAVASRPAMYNLETGWSYPDAVNTPELQEAARLLTSNWLLMRWGDVITEGVRAKVYKRLADTERARTSYSMYKGLCKGLWTSETAKLYTGA